MSRPRAKTVQDLRWGYALFQPTAGEIEWGGIVDRANGTMIIPEKNARIWGRLTQLKDAAYGNTVIK